jgi:hypothetical protein
MERKTKIAAALLLLSLGSIAQTQAQSNLVQTLNIRLVAYNPSQNSNNVQLVRITTKDVIQAFAGSAVPKGQLQLVTPPGNQPGMTGDLNAFLRVTSGNTTVTTVPSPDSFNLFQDGAIVQTRGSHTVSHSLNRFSIDFGAFHAELQGYSTWNIVSKSQGGIDLGGSGPFTSNVNGVSTWDNVTISEVPTQGTVTASAPKPGP